MKSALVIAFVYLLATSVLADTYMHNPRGSNDRLNEANTNRNNGNRLFDSQNNAKGGYCVGPAMSFYEGSLLAVQWTAQHGCGNPKLWCNIVFQYMCGPATPDGTVRIRDGTTTDTITDTPNAATQVDANGQLLFGMHENFQFYQDCKTRDRNKGLFIADREKGGNLDQNRASSIFTRQNNNGDRHGYECPEERDYYPYWAPSPWKDIAVLTQDKKFCDFYQRESQNVKRRGVCKDKTTGVLTAPNNPTDCGVAGGSWDESVDNSFGLPPPECLPTFFTRDNHLGSSASEEGAVDRQYNWTLPTIGQLKNCDGSAGPNACQCVLRLRYNISAGDLASQNPNGNNPDAGFIDYNNNAASSPIQDDSINVVGGAGGAQVQLALDTTQFFRTFQDRSHVFSIISRPPGVGIGRIFNLNVRGKRGNIVQTYPATEYDFVPNNLHVRLGDFIHFQWTGCDTNPAGNAGEGTDQTDRSNIVQIRDFGQSMPLTDDELDQNPGDAKGNNGNGKGKGKVSPMFDSADTRNFFAYLGQTNCPTQEQLLAKNNNNANTAKQDPTNCFKLNAAPQYFNGGLLKMNRTGEFYYISTRNNNFSNRDQKGVLFVDNVIPIWGIAVVAVGGAICVASGAVAGAMFYAKSHPHSGVANIVSKF